jgi:hypothetical protein
MARQRQALIAGLRDSVNDFGTSVPNVSAKDVMELLLVTQVS